MPQTCSVCKSKRLADIDGELIRNRALRSIAKQFRVSPASLFRHKQHLSDKLTLAKEHQDALSAESLLAEMGELKSKLRIGLDDAAKNRNAPGFVAFARELRQTLESYFDLTERMAARTDGNDNQAMTVEIRTLGLPDTCPYCGEHIDHIVRRCCREGDFHSWSQQRPSPPSDSISKSKGGRALAQNGPPARQADSEENMLTRAMASPWFPAPQTG